MERTVENLRIFHRVAPVHVLGPFARAVVWVQGCPFRCPGCTSPEALDFAGGEAVSVADLAAWALAQDGIEGLTFSGGEPMAQAAGLCRLVDAVRARADLGVVCYTGDTLERLRDEGTDDQRALLTRVDLLIDGPYIREQHAKILWRGSANQRLLPLTDRYRDLLPVSEAEDRPAGLEAFIAESGLVHLAGVPPEPDYRTLWKRRV